MRGKLIATCTAALLCLLLIATPAPAQDKAPPQGANSLKGFFVVNDIIGQLQIVLLLGMSVATVALVIRHSMLNGAKKLLPMEAVAEYSAMLDEKRYSEAMEKSSQDPSLFGQLLHAAMSEASNGYGAMERAIEETGDLQSSKRIRAMELLNVLGATGPMVGLFGTVYGMIVAFNQLVASGGAPNPGELAAGISTALVTTFWGLVVGIPAVAAVALIRAKIDGTTVDAMIHCEGLISRFKPSKKPAPAPAKPAVASASASVAKPKPAAAAPTA